MNDSNSPETTTHEDSLEDHPIREEPTVPFSESPKFIEKTGVIFVEGDKDDIVHSELGQSIIGDFEKPNETTLSNKKLTPNEQYAEKSLLGELRKSREHVEILLLKQQELKLGANDLKNWKKEGTTTIPLNKRVREKILPIEEDEESLKDLVNNPIDFPENPQLLESQSKAEKNFLEMISKMKHSVDQLKDFKKMIGNLAEQASMAEKFSEYNEQLHANLKKLQQQYEEISNEKQKLSQKMQLWKSHMIEKDSMLINNLKREELHVRKLRHHIKEVKLVNLNREQSMEHLFKLAIEHNLPIADFYKQYSQCRKEYSKIFPGNHQKVTKDDVEKQYKDLSKLHDTIIQGSLVLLEDKEYVQKLKQSGYEKIRLSNLKNISAIDIDVEIERLKRENNEKSSSNIAAESVKPRCLYKDPVMDPFTKVEHEMEEKLANLEQILHQDIEPHIKARIFGSQARNLVLLITKTAFVDKNDKNLRLQNIEDIFVRCLVFLHKNSPKYIERGKILKSSSHSLKKLKDDMNSLKQDLSQFNFIDFGNEISGKIQERDLEQERKFNDFQEIMQNSISELQTALSASRAREKEIANMYPISPKTPGGNMLRFHQNHLKVPGTEKHHRKKKGTSNTAITPSNGENQNDTTLEINQESVKREPSDISNIDYDKQSTDGSECLESGEDGECSSVEEISATSLQNNSSQVSSLPSITKYPATPRYQTAVQQKSLQSSDKIPEILTSRNQNNNNKVEKKPAKNKKEVSIKKDSSSERSKRLKEDQVSKGVDQDSDKERINKDTSPTTDWDNSSGPKEVSDEIVINVPVDIPLQETKEKHIPNSDGDGECGNAHNFAEERENTQRDVPDQIETKKTKPAENKIDLVQRTEIQDRIADDLTSQRDVNIQKGVGELGKDTKKNETAQRTIQNSKNGKVHSKQKETWKKNQLNGKENQENDTISKKQNGKIKKKNDNDHNKRNLERKNQKIRRNRGSKVTGDTTIAVSQDSTENLNHPPNPSDLNTEKGDPLKQNSSIHVKDEKEDPQVVQSKATKAGFELDTSINTIEKLSFDNHVESHAAEIDDVSTWSTNHNDVLSRSGTAASSRSRRSTRSRTKSNPSPPPPLARTMSSGNEKSSPMNIAGVEKIENLQPSLLRKPPPKNISFFPEKTNREPSIGDSPNFQQTSNTLSPKENEKLKQNEKENNPPNRVVENASKKISKEVSDKSVQSIVKSTRSSDDTSSKTGKISHGDSLFSRSNTKKQHATKKVDNFNLVVTNRNLQQNSERSEEDEDVFANSKVNMTYRAPKSFRNYNSKKKIQSTRRKTLPDNSLFISTTVSSDSKNDSIKNSSQDENVIDRNKRRYNKLSKHPKQITTGTLPVVNADNWL